MIKYPEAKQIALQFTYDAAPVDEVIKNIQKDVDKDPINATIALKGGSFKVNPDQKGYQLKTRPPHHYVDCKVCDNKEN